jgi:S1-C subfamily serine protease
MGKLGKEPTKVIQVSEDSVAAHAGIKVGDILRSLDGVAIDSGATLQKQTGNYRWGDVAQLTLERDGTAQTLPVAFRRQD